MCNINSFTPILLENVETDDFDEIDDTLNQAGQRQPSQEAPQQKAEFDDEDEAEVEVSNYIL